MAINFKIYEDETATPATESIETPFLEPELGHREVAAPEDVGAEISLDSEWPDDLPCSTPKSSSRNQSPSGHLRSTSDGIDELIARVDLQIREFRAISQVERNIVEELAVLGLEHEPPGSGFDSEADSHGSNSRKKAIWRSLGIAALRRLEKLRHVEWRAGYPECFADFCVFRRGNTDKTRTPSSESAASNNNDPIPNSLKTSQCAREVSPSGSIRSPLRSGDTTPSSLLRLSPVDTPSLTWLIPELCLQSPTQVQNRKVSHTFRRQVDSSVGRTGTRSPEPPVPAMTPRSTDDTGLTLEQNRDAIPEADGLAETAESEGSWVVELNEWSRKKVAVQRPVSPSRETMIGERDADIGPDSEPESAHDSLPKLFSRENIALEGPSAGQQSGGEEGTRPGNASPCSKLRRRVLENAPGPDHYEVVFDTSSWWWPASQMAPRLMSIMEEFHVRRPSC